MLKNLKEKKTQERKEAKEKRALERQRKRNGKEKTLKGTHYRRRGSHSQPMSSVCVEDLASDLEQLTVLHDDSDGECPNCDKLFSEECLWVCCDECQQWYDIECQNYQERTSQNGLFVINVNNSMMLVWLLTILL